jgi:hypothetical protein
MSGARRLVLSGIALIALLSVVALASHAHHPGGGTGAGPENPPRLLVDYFVSVMIVLFPFGAIFIVWGMFRSRRQALLEGRTSWRRTLALVTAVSIIGASAAYFARGHTFFGGPHQPSSPAVHNAKSAKKGKGSKAGGTTALPAEPPAGHFRWEIALVLGSIAAALGFSAAATYYRRLRGGDLWDKEAALAVALDEVLADTLDDLRAEADPRRAVIRTYARMEKTFAAYGVSRDEAETPREYVERVLGRLQVSAFAVQRLARLYERAKFSEHEIDMTMKDEAIETLVGLRAELEYKPEERAA